LKGRDEETGSKINQIVPMRSETPVKFNSEEPTEGLNKNQQRQSINTGKIKLPPLELAIMQEESKMNDITINSSQMDLKGLPETPIDTETESQQGKLQQNGQKNIKFSQKRLKQNSRNFGMRESTTANNTDGSGNEGLSNSGIVLTGNSAGDKGGDKDEEFDSIYRRSLSKERAPKAYAQHREKRHSLGMREKMKSTKDILLENRIEI